VQCLKGRLFDVIVDLRPDSQSYKKWVGITLSGRKKDMVYVPEGCAHGYVTLTGDCLISYMISKEYTEESAQGIRWDDPSIAITWPQLPLHISDKDSTWPFLTQK
jgi:dTDP-4-dehydrorhamnose 3,5-epimerase